MVKSISLVLILSLASVLSLPTTNNRAADVYSRRQVSRAEVVARNARTRTNPKRATISNGVRTNIAHAQWERTYSNSATFLSDGMTLQACVDACDNDPSCVHAAYDPTGNIATARCMNGSTMDYNDLRPSSSFTFYVKGTCASTQPWVDINKTGTCTDVMM